jgi:putative transcription antitermination factor YqgF
MIYLGVDVGLKRVGLAISEGVLASPLKVLEVSSLKDSVQKVQKEVIKNQVDKVVVGVPEGGTGKMILSYIKELKKVGLNVEVADETLSSQNALHSMIELGLSKKDRSVNDAYAAALILQNYLDSLSS